MTSLITGVGSTLTHAVAQLSLSSTTKVRDFDVSVVRSDVGSTPGQSVLVACVTGAKGFNKTIRTATGSTVAHATSVLALVGTERIEKIQVGHGVDSLGSVFGVEIAVLTSDNAQL